MPDLQAILDQCTKNNVREPSSLVDAQVTIKDRISSIPRVVQPTDELSETKQTYLAHSNQHEKEAVPLNSLVSQRILLQRRTADKLVNV